LCRGVLHAVAGYREHYGHLRRERVGELAVLKAIGYPDRYVLFFVLSEALVIALIGGLIGLGLAVLAIPVVGAA